MTVVKGLFFTIVILLYSLIVQAAVNKLNVELFMSSTCPHCHKANEFLQTIEKNQPWLTIHRYYINQDKKALERFYEHLKKEKSMNFAVPALFFCGKHLFGFKDGDSTGKLWLQALTTCRDNS